VAYVPMPVLNGSAARLAISRTRHIHAIFRSLFERPFSLQWICFDLPGPNLRYRGYRSTDAQVSGVQLINATNQRTVGDKEGETRRC
jgi:hypothetical protein